MANNQRRAAPGALNKSQPARNQVQLKQTGPHAPQQTSGPGPHINQHSAYLQRIAQPKIVKPKMGQSTAAPKLVSGRSILQPKLKNVVPAANRVGSPPPGARRAGVVQRACLLDCFRGLFGSSSSSSSRSEYVEIPDRGVQSSQSSVPIRIETPTLKTTFVDQTQLAKNVSLPASLNGCLITTCALVIFCDDDNLDCYHASGGSFTSSHGMRSNPTRVIYVYMSLGTDSSATVDEYRRNAELYRHSANRAPLTFLGQQGVKSNIWIDVYGPTDVRPHMGKFV